MILETKIDEGRIIKTIGRKYPDCGGFIIFLGKVRADRVGKKVVRGIYYDVYKKVCIKVFNSIKSSAMKKYSVRDIIIVHRAGYVKVGETSLFVIVISPHRKNGISALKYVIDELKKKAPIWKKEIFSNNKYRWIVHKDKKHI